MNKNRAELIRACDRLWSRLIAHSFNYRCAVTGTPGGDAHHWRFIRSYLIHRWTLENGIYLNRVVHNETEQNHMPLYLKIKADYPHLWTWAESQPPLDSRPISTMQITDILAGLQHTAEQLGVSYA